jgi:hypothetical protein
MPTPSTVPPPATVRPPPFTLAEYRAHNDRLEARLRAPEVALRQLHAEIGAVLAVIAKREARRGRR